MRNFTTFLFTISLALTGSLLFSACSTAPTNPKNVTDDGPSLPEVRAEFTKHWAKAGQDVKVLEVVAMDDGWFRGNAIIDQRPVEEFYDSTQKHFTRTRPSGKEQRTTGEELSYKDFVAALTTQLATDLGEERIAVVGVPSDRGKLTELSQDLANKIEVNLIKAGKKVVDRATIQKVLDEQSLQQKDNALFDATLLARIGKFAGASIVVHGTYSLMPNKQLTVTLKAVSVETTHVITAKQEDYPLTGAGAASREQIMSLSGTPAPR